MFTEATIDAMVEADRDDAVEQLHLPYKHPSNTLTTIPRAIRRLTRSGRRTPEQVEAALVRLGIKGDRFKCRTCILAAYFACVTGLGCNVAATTVYHRDTYTEYPLGLVLSQVRVRFDTGRSAPELYNGGVS